MIRLKENTLMAQDHYLSIEQSLKDAIARIIKNGYILKGRKKSKKKVMLSHALSIYFHDLLRSDLLEQLIIMPPAKLKAKVTNLKQMYPDFFTKGADDHTILKNVFVGHGYEKIDKYEFVRRIDIDTCPYCNRNYIYFFEKKGKTVKPQIDHFFPQEKYPLFGSSFYNLIPSCQNCNGLDGKKESDPISERLEHPYLINENQFLFSYKIRSINVLNPLKNKSSVKVRLKAPTGNNKLFNLKGFYSMHNDHVLELIIKSKIKYPKAYRSHLRKIKNFRFSDKEINRMILGNYTEADEIHLRPLAKLYQDIGIELGLIKGR